MSETHPLQPGDPTELGDYRLIGRLGKGAQGVVFKGQGADGQLVAIKLLNTRLDKPGIDGERFMREVDAARRVAQFCTAQVIGANMEGEAPYIVSELVDGVSLQRVVQTDGPRRGGALHRLAVGTVTALTAIHRAGIVHRDFKPSNVLIGSDGPRVIDFGIARALDSAMTISSGVVGTPAYMSPEQISGERVGPPGDMFAWGLTMAFAATGRPAFGQDSLPAVIYRVMNEEADLSALPGTLREIVRACLSKRADERPSAADTLFALLENQGAAAERDDEIAMTTGVQVATEESAVENSQPTMPPQPPAPSGWANPSGQYGRPPLSPPQYAAPPQQYYNAQNQQPYAAPNHQPPNHRPPNHQAPTQLPNYAPPYPLNEPPRSDNDAFFKDAQPDPHGTPPARRKRAGLVAGALVIALALSATLLVVVPRMFATEQQPNPPKPTVVAQTPAPTPTPTPTPTVTPTETAVVLPELGKQDGKPLKGHSKAVQTVSAINIGGKLMLISGGQDGQLRIWDAAKHKYVAQLKGHKQEVYAVACFTNGKTPMAVSGGFDGTVRLWDLKKKKGKVLGKHDDSVYAVAVGKVGGKWIAVTGDARGWLKFWDLGKRKKIGKTVRAHYKAVNWLSVGKVGTRTVAVTASEDKTLRVWDMAKRKSYGKTYKGHTKGVYSIAIGAIDGKPVIASGGKDKKIHLWNPANAKRVATLSAHKNIVYSLSFGVVQDHVLLLSGSTDGTMILWDAEKRKKIGKPVKAHSKGVLFVAIVNDGGQPAVVTAGKDKQIKMWSLDNATTGS
ncbi:protein kinase [Nonomuraea sp. NBC_01738]|uniref:protein kinase domain-containing protein n=1 Tax=Nonomuraea sp. NBC_01738 TaxID=2976003 RepID=UPI002E163538|nr:protein kinase [Nonomuraea sp. NBC_01738]